ncbi:MAG: UDP-N-acetylmuramoyl-L-alanyl-D-glutamate--2,6-diaminopimelate ligase [bacterium]
MDLKSIGDNIDYRSFNVKENVSINGISSDSRKIEKGDLFIAVKGFEYDGHDFIRQAVSRGAAAVVAEKYKGKDDVPLILVDNSRKARAEIARKFYGNPAEGMDIIGITGTNGKTTVSLLLESILQAQGKETGLLSTLYYRWDKTETSASRTTPDSIELYKYLLDMKNQGITSVVMEISSHALSLYRVEGIQFQAAVFTNISRDHLKFHSSMDDYAKVKSKLFTMLRPDGVGVIHGEDYYAEKMIKASNQRVVTFGENTDNDYHLGEVDHTREYTHFTLEGKCKVIKLKTSLKGHFNILNCVAAAVAGIEIGYDIAAIKRGIEQVKRVPGRMEYIDSARGFLVIVDYAHTPVAIGNTLNEVRKITRNRVIAVFGCGGDRDKGKRSLMGKKAVQYADYTIVTTDNPRTEDPSVIISDIMKGIKIKNKVKIIENRKQAIHYALDMAKENDSVVLLGKGHETYQEIGTRRFPFDDKKVAREYLEL